MSAATLQDDSRDLALELRGLLEQIDRWNPAISTRTTLAALDGLRERLVAVRDLVARLLGLAEGRTGFGALRDALADAHRVLAERLPEAGLAPREARRAWKAFRAELLAAYDRLGTSLAAWDIHVPSLRPTNYTRNVFHVAWAGVVLVVLGLVPEAWLLPIVLGFFFAGWTMETTRRLSTRVNRFLMALFGPVAHPHEWYRVNSATWYVSAMLVLCVADVLVAGVAAVAVLGVGDPAAAVIGRRFGRIRIANGRSLEGTAAFVVTAWLAALAALRLLHPELGLGLSVVTALAAAVTGAIAELVARRIDDNFAIPLASAFGAAVVLQLAGVSP